MATRPAHGQAMNIDSRALARTLGGELWGRNILAPGPGHSSADRSLSIKIDPTAPEGFIVHSFAGDASMECREYVRSAVNAGRGRAKAPESPKSLYSLTPNRSADRRSAFALKLWTEGRDPRGTLVATYLAARGLTIS